MYNLLKNKICDKILMKMRLFLPHIRVKTGTRDPRPTHAQKKFHVYLPFPQNCLLDIKKAVGATLNDSPTANEMITAILTKSVYAISTDRSCWQLELDLPMQSVVDDFPRYNKPDVISALKCPAFNTTVPILLLVINI